AVLAFGARVVRIDLPGPGVSGIEQAVELGGAVEVVDGDVRVGTEWHYRLRDAGLHRSGEVRRVRVPIGRKHRRRAADQREELAESTVLGLAAVEQPLGLPVERVEAEVGSGIDALDLLAVDD